MNTWLKILGFILFFGILALKLAAQPEDWKQIKKQVLQTPKEVEHKVDLLHPYLVKNIPDDYSKVSAFYLWIAYNIRYDQEAAKALDKQKRIPDITETLKSKRAICTGYSRLFAALCQRSQIPCLVIDGYSKALPASRPNLSETDHAWNAVKIDGKWYLVDVTWAAGVYRNNNKMDIRGIDYYFLPPPERMIADHLPANPLWQLLPCPVSPQQFNLPYQQLKDHLAQTKPCGNLSDSLLVFEQLSQPAQHIKSLENAHRFNPSRENAIQLGQAYMDRFIVLAEQEETLQEGGQWDTLLLLYPQLFQWAEKAEKYVTLFDWQKENLAYTHINYAVVLSRNLATLEINDRENQLLQMEQSLEKALDILTSLPPSFFVNNGIQTCREYLSFVQENGNN